MQRPAQSQSSHLPGDRLEIEAVFAQLTLSHGQDKHTALYTYTSTVCHSLPRGDAGHCEHSQISVVSTHAGLLCVACSPDFCMPADTRKIGLTSHTLCHGHYLPICRTICHPWVTYSINVTPLQVRIDGLTGHIQFNEKGRRTNYTVSIMELAPSGPKKVSFERDGEVPDTSSGSFLMQAHC